VEGVADEVAEEGEGGSRMFCVHFAATWAGGADLDSLWTASTRRLSVLLRYHGWEKEPLAQIKSDCILKDLFGFDMVSVSR
jgi:hypothetical protein